MPILRTVPDIGVNLSLDDFGTGYSCLSYLQRLPVQEVKIDRSFVLGPGWADELAGQRCPHPQHHHHGRDLGLRIVAEGVENAHVLDVLRGLGCDPAQGYHIGRPGTSEQLMALLETTNHVAAIDGSNTSAAVPRPRAPLSIVVP